MARKLADLRGVAVIFKHTRPVYQAGRVSDQRSGGLEVLADQQCGGCAFACRRGHLLGAASAHVPRGEDARETGLQETWLAVFEAARPRAVMHQVVPGHNKAPPVEADLLGLQEPGVGRQADEDEDTRGVDDLGAGALAVPDVTALSLPPAPSKRTTSVLKRTSILG